MVATEPPVRVVASDLDGTLLDPAGEVSERTAAVLHRIRDLGIHVVAVTGRPPRWVHHLADGLVGPAAEVELESETGRPPVEEQELAETAAGLAICSNGALVVDLHTREVVIEHRIPVEVAAAVVERLTEALPDASFAVERADQFGCDERWHERLRARAVDAEAHRAGAGDAMLANVAVAPAAELTTEPPVKILAWVPGASGDTLIDAAEAAVGSLATVTASGGQELIEVSARGVNKGSALAEWCAGRGIEAAEVVAFGDARNDVAMLGWAGLGVAMADAHPDAKAAADELCAPNDEDGVAAWLEDKLLEESRPF